jgi:ribose-phosphate pyrophosphokinase
VLSAFHILTDYFLKFRDELENPVVLTADLGFAKKGRNFAAAIDASMAFVEKRRRARSNEPEALTIIGSVEGRDVIVIDDEVDTGGSVSQAVNLAKSHGARDIYLLFVHPIFSKGTVERLAALPVEKIITTDTIPIPSRSREMLRGKLTVCSIAPLLGEVIRRAHEGRSVGEMFNE